MTAFLLRQTSADDAQAQASAAPMPSSISVTAFGPQIVTPAELASHAADAGYPAGFPLYWAGPVTGTHIELTILGDGTWGVRYLPQDAAVGSPADSLTIATFYQPDGAVRVTRIAEAPGAKSMSYGTGAIAASESATANTISFAFESQPVLVVVTSNDPASAWDLLDAGVVRPVNE